MQRLIFSSTSLLYMLALLWIASVSIAQPSSTHFSYGRVSHTHLSDFSPAKSDVAYRLLIEKCLPEAAELLEKELAQYPDSLAAFVGLAQARPETWSVHIVRLEASGAGTQAQRADSNGSKADAPANATAKFKLGVLLYYRWGQRREPDDMTDLVRAQELIHQAWLESRWPIMAMMLDEVARVPSVYTRQYPAMTADIHEKLIAQLAPKAYDSYQQAKASGWNSAPPPMAAIPTENLRSLRGVIRNLWNQSGVLVGLWGVKDGLFLFLEEPRETDGEAKAEYLKTWFEALTQAISK